MPQGRNPALEPLADHCDWRNCPRAATSRLWFGRPRPFPADYCAEHAATVEKWFMVVPAPQQCEGLGIKGPCRLAAAPGSRYCHWHQPGRLAA